MGLSATAVQDLPPTPYAKASRDWPAGDVNPAAFAEPSKTAARRLLASWGVLSVDVETNPPGGDRTFKLSAARSDSVTAVSFSTRGLSVAELVRRVDDLAQGARLFISHNLCHHGTHA